MVAHKQIEIKVRQAVPWSGLEVLAVAFTGLLLPWLLYQLFFYSGWYRWFYGPDFFQQPFPEPFPPPARHPAPGYAQLMLWAGCAALPFQVAHTFLLLWASSGTRPGDVGLTRNNLEKSLMIGLWSALVLVPSVYGVQWVLLEAHQVGELAHSGPSLHRVGQGVALSGGVGFACVCRRRRRSGVGRKSLLFRGLVQRWVMSRPYGGWAALGLALVWTLAVKLDRLNVLLGELMVSGTGGRDLFGELLPLLVLLGLMLVYSALLEKREQTAGLFATAVLFAWVHVRVWPSPIPLLLLALGLGWLARQTRNLAGPMLVHALFNSVACLLLILRPFLV